MKTYEFFLNRKTNFPKKCLGEIIHENMKICDTLEPHSKSFISEMTESYIYARKKVHFEAIPKGRYKIIKCYSTTFKKDMFYLENVKCFISIMFHAGQTEIDTKGCILVGTRTKQNNLINSTASLNKLTDILAYYMTKGHECYLTVTEDFYNNENF